MEKNYEKLPRKSQSWKTVVPGFHEVYIAEVSGDRKKSGEKIVSVVQ